ncbi:aspartate/glutamate racemase family protein [Rubrimonas cliftonensis]|uniref:Allantoin racemase n=1 Tax=Rubrimonas cliftonensis TaxID=89524 RepID=A0A1H4C5J7_9RHOB|nr:aspartate/glutamate racemase family protein [Rubrimonas cliftonensis]SEA55661.1 allantoin racemase [Rubrimonas cliftonensis]
MRLLIVNPNATEAMTRAIARGAQAAAGPGVSITALTNHDGPPAIQGAADGDAATPGVLARLAAHQTEADAAIIACFDDTGLEEARAASGIPVLGLGEAAYLAACMRGGRFSVVTTLAVSIPVIEENLRRYALDRRCVRVRASGVPVLALEETPEAAAAQIDAEIARAGAEDGVSAVVLGCAGMTGVLHLLNAPKGVALIDSTAAAAALAVAAARLAAPRVPA